MRSIFYCLLIAFFAIQGSVTAQQQYPRQKDAAIIQAKTDSIQITVSDNRITIANAPIGSKLEIFSMDGKLVESKQVDLKSGANLIDVKLQKLQNYILKISDGTTTETFRISN